MTAEEKQRRKEYNQKWRLANPEKKRESDRNWRLRNADKVRENNRRWRAKHPEYQAEFARRWRKKHPELVEKRNKETREKKKNSFGVGLVGPCEGCTKISTLDRDHDHKTGKQRGKLCRQCNLALGLIKDNAETLKNLIGYLGKYHDKLK